MTNYRKMKTNDLITIYVRIADTAIQAAIVTELTRRSDRGFWIVTTPAIVWIISIIIGTTWMIYHG
jgi:hypothetical protein